jgi:hypothetical protein
MKIIYTESALVELERFQEQRKEELEGLLKKRKYVFGDDVLEITASDIRDAERHFKMSDISKSRLPLTSMLFKLYMIMGILMVFVGIFYPDLRQLIDRNPLQLALVLTGVMLSLVSFFGSYYFRIREIRRAEIERRYIEFETIKKADFEKDS